MHIKEMKKALDYFDNVEEAAKALGISARKLYAFKKKLKLKNK